MTQNSKKQFTQFISFGYSLELLSLTLLTLNFQNTLQK